MIAASTPYKTALASFSAGKIYLRVSISGYSRVFENFSSGVGGHYPWLVSADDFSTTINDLDGGADAGTFAFTVQDRGAAVTGDFPGFVFEGKVVTVEMGLSPTLFTTVFTGFVDTVASANANNEYYFTCVDLANKLTQVIYQTFGGKSVDSNNMYEINAHPLDIVENILTVQCGLTSGDYNQTKLHAYRDSIFAGLQFVFNISQPPAAADFIKNQLLKPLGGYMWVNSLGQFDFNFFYPIDGPTTVGTLGPDVWTSIPEAEQTDMVNTAQFQFDKDDATAGATGNYLAQVTSEYGPSTALYGQFGEVVIQSDGLRSGYQGVFISKMISRLIFMRYGFKNLTFNSSAPEGIWQLSLYEPGDLLNVTHPRVPDRKAGVMGVTNKIFEVLNRTLNFTEGKVTLTLLDASYLSTFGIYLITTDGESPYAAASSPDKGKYMFMCDDTGHYTNSDPGHPLG